jgi:uncharacterized protein (TIGR02246 family)
MAPLTVEDRLEIHELYARFAHAIDAGDVEAWVALFTPEGTFLLAGDPLTGAEQLREFATRRSREAPGMFHLTTGIVLDGTSQVAKGRAYVVTYRLAGDGQLRLLNIGRYDDDLVKTAEGWRLAARRVLSEIPQAIRDAPFVFAPGT